MKVGWSVPVVAGIKRGLFKFGAWPVILGCLVVVTARITKVHAAKLDASGYRKANAA
jgi:hypothetical protein